MLPEIRKTYPAGLGNEIRRYCEPFIGGGAVLFDILSNHDLDELYISDINAELILTYSAIRNNVRHLIEILSHMESRYLEHDEEGRNAFFYEIRERFNNLKTDASSDSTELGALFIFLNRTCFNGLYRVNKKGGYNVPHGKYKNPKICNESNLLAISSALANVEIHCCDYRESRDFISGDTFVYIDPPYRPLSKTASFTSYTENIFNDAEQIALADFVTEVSKTGAFVVVSNSDPKNQDKDDNFFDDLYSEFNINRISAKRMINSNASLRGSISELLVTNYWDKNERF